MELCIDKRPNDIIIPIELAKKIYADFKTEEILSEKDGVCKISILKLK